MEGRGRRREDPDTAGPDVRHGEPRAAKKTPSPTVLPLGTHSATLDTFGGGPGTVALHGWPDASVFGKAITHGCVRVPADALKALSRVPLGSLVLITA
ncbi:L,D-transpeptidase [Actinomadura madurae]|nr:L,D-transpeptidase [Actinomadura madurae]MCP9981085.1 L,D-transpeptidase [Actinomadura madurae]